MRQWRGVAAVAVAAAGEAEERCDDAVTGASPRETGC